MGVGVMEKKIAPYAMKYVHCHWNAVMGLLRELKNVMEVQTARMIARGLRQGPVLPSAG